MASKKHTRKGSKPAPRKGRKPAPVPRWKKDGFSSYRQYLNARYQKLGFRNYADYTTQREKGLAPSTKKPKRPPKPVRKEPEPLSDKQKRAIEVSVHEAPPVGTITRTQYTFLAPFEYGPGDMVADALAAWLVDDVFPYIENLHPPTQIYSGAYTIFGRVAKELDANGEPIFSQEEDKEWSPHMAWEKMRNDLIGLLRAYGDHDFREHGRQGTRKTGSIVYIFLLKRLTISVTQETAEPPKV